jgi:phosphoribosylpyrophosphate synthetase
MWILLQGFFDRPIDNLQGYPFLVRYIQENVSGVLRDDKLTSIGKDLEFTTYSNRF